MLINKNILGVFLSLIFIFSLVHALPSDSDTDLAFTYPINYSTIPTVNNSQFFDGYSVATLWTYYTGLGNALWCQLTGCTMEGNIDMGGNNITANYFFGNGSQLTGLPTPDVNKTYVDDNDLWQTDGTNTSLKTAQDISLATKNLWFRTNFKMFADTTEGIKLEYGVGQGKQTFARSGIVRFYNTLGNYFQMNPDGTIYTSTGLISFFTNNVITTGNITADNFIENGYQVASYELTTEGTNTTLKWLR